MKDFFYQLNPPVSVVVAAPVLLLCSNVPTQHRFHSLQRRTLLLEQKTMSLFHTKPDAAEAEVGHYESQRNKEHDEIGRIDALATAPGTTFESFSHIDEKKVLRKVCLMATTRVYLRVSVRLIPE
jgi:hypothetical protein